MAIVRKDKYVKDIANRVGRGAMFFEAEDRPSLMMGGRQVYVSSVGYDSLDGKLTYSVSDERGRVLLSSKGVRPLDELDGRTLSAVSAVVAEYARLRQQRTENLVNVQTRAAQLLPKRPSGGVKL